MFHCKQEPSFLIFCLFIFFLTYLDSWTPVLFSGFYSITVLIYFDAEINPDVATFDLASASSDTATPTPQSAGPCPIIFGATLFLAQFSTFYLLCLSHYNQLFPPGTLFLLVGNGRNQHLSTRYASCY